MSKPNIVYLDVSTGEASRARDLVAKQYQGFQLVELSHRQLRDSGWKGQIKTFFSLKGQALIFYFDSFTDSKQAEIMPWLGLVHGCRETAIVDRVGDWRVYRRRDWIWMLPRTVFGLLSDAAVFLFCLFYLKLWRMRPPRLNGQQASPNVAYLFPFPLTAVAAGGAVSHIRGFLGGLASNHTPCRIFSGTPLPTDSYPVELIPARGKLSVFWESKMLSYNFLFATQVQKELREQPPPSLLYQRHGRFSIAGAILSRRMRVPLVLEYNGSEVWMSEYWDPARFRKWLQLCEEAALKSASLIVVVSEPLKDELQARGIPAERVLVNPNAVDPEYFHPQCGGDKVRKVLGLPSNEIVVEFVGTFSQWHGLTVLQESIARLLQPGGPSNFTFLLIGHGPLHGEMREFLKAQEASGKVIFTGLISHEKVREYLDAAAILVSPHIPMPDGSPFFGSPTKLFEYMAMGKGIVASNLDQLAKVLEHNVTAWMIAPGSVDQLVDAIQRLASQPDLRARLGAAARAAAIERHSWRNNSEMVLKHAGLCGAPGVSDVAVPKVQSGHPQGSTA
jgi:glycosyltransferase involved in cell wall biosynthesis